uniref:Uncharacterized protein n=1 Tax=Opuntia streptacantha TaxID=393608 RepID=A0A7C9ET50_OPUST
MGSSSFGISRVIPTLNIMANEFRQYVDPSVRKTRKTPMHAVLPPNCNCILFSKPNRRMSICSVLTQMGQIKFLNVASLQCRLNYLIKLSLFFVDSVVTGIKP